MPRNQQDPNTVGGPRRPAQTPPTDPHRQQQRPQQRLRQPAALPQQARRPVQPQQTGDPRRSARRAPLPATAPTTTAELAALRPAEQQESGQYIRIFTGVDRPFFIIVLVMLAFGLVMGFSASYSYASHEHGDAMHFLVKNIILAAMGLLFMFITMHIELPGIRWLTFPGYIVCIIALILVLIPGIGLAEGDARRWIPIPGVGTFQPSEAGKLALVMVLARHLAKHQDKITGDNRHDRWPVSFFWGGIVSCLWIGSVAGLVALEHHISGTLIIVAIGIILMFIGRVKMRYFIVAGLLVALAVVLLLTFSNYGMTRIEVWKMVLFDPTNIPKDVQQDAAYQNLQGLYAIGSGGIFGTGLGNSFQKYGYVSQPQNDFIFSIICEELGFIGALAVILLFVAFGWRGFVIARNAPDLFSSLVVSGITVQVVLQAILNICVVTALVPNTGISLPFFSSGGTSLVILLCEMGIVLSISRYSYQKRT